MKRSIKHGTASAINILLVIGILIIIVLFSYNNQKKYDLTEEKMFTLSEQTVKILDSLEKDVTVYVFFEKGSGFMEQARELIDQYRYHNRKITLIPMDSTRNIAEARQYGITNPNSLVVEGPVVDDAPQVNPAEPPAASREILTEAKEEGLTNAILKVTRDKQFIVYFTTGHGERDIENKEGDGYTLVKQGLENDAFGVEKVNLVEEDVPEDCTALVVAGPKSDFAELEMTRLKEYIELRSGNVYLLFEPKEETPKLFEYLKQYGIDVRDDIIIDQESQRRGGDFMMPVGITRSGHPITDEFEQMILFPFARSIKVYADVPPHTVVNELSVTSEQTWGETGELVPGATIQYNENKDARGPLTIVAALQIPIDSERIEEEGLEPAPRDKGRLVISGCTNFAANEYFYFMGNSNFFMNGIGWMSEQENLISIRPKNTPFKPINLQAVDRNIIFSSIVLLPILIILLGLYMFLMKADHPLSPEFQPFVFGTLFLGGLAAVPFTWTLIAGMEYFQALPTALFICVLFLFAFQRDFRIVWVRAVVSIVGLGMVSAFLAINTNEPKMVAAVAASVIVYGCCGYLGIWGSRLLDKLLPETKKA